MSQKSYDLFFEICYLELKVIFENHILGQIVQCLFQKYYVHEEESERQGYEIVKHLLMGINPLVRIRLDAEILFVPLQNMGKIRKENLYF